MTQAQFNAKLAAEAKLTDCTTEVNAWYATLSK